MPAAASVSRLSIGFLPSGPLRLLPLRGFRRRFLLVTRDLENVVKADVRFATRVLVEVSFTCTHRKRHGPRPHEGVRIVDGEPEVDRVLAHACEALDRVKGRAGAPVAGLVREVLALDNQRIAIPVATRLAEPLMDLRAELRASIQWDEPRLVNHLVRDRDVSRTLNDPDVVVIEAGENRGGEPPGNAPLERAAVLRPIGAPGPGSAAGRCPRLSLG